MKTTAPEITFTEEMVMNPDALNGIPIDFRYYREEIWVGEGFPLEEGHLWLPPYVDICDIEDLINGRVHRKDSV